MQRYSGQPRRIAHIIPNLLPFGGVERVILSHIRQYLRLGIKVDLVFINEPQDVAEHVHPDCRVFNLGAQRLRHAIAPLVRYLRQERPDAIHATMWPLTTLVAVSRKLAGSPARLLLSDHNPLSIQYAPRGRLHHALLRASIAVTYPWADCLVAVSGGVADDLVKLSGLDRRRFTVIHNPISLPEHAVSQDIAAEKAWGGWCGKRIITAGRMKAQKNHRMLLRSFQKLLQRIDSRLMILGTGELSEQTAAYANMLGLSGKVFMTGQVEDPAAYYRSADLFVLSSDYEGFGNVIIEALSCGLPVVSTDCPGGPAEILLSGAYGRLVPVGDEAALTDAMASSLTEPAEKERLKQRAAEFAPSVISKKYLTLLLPELIPFPDTLRSHP